MYALLRDYCDGDEILEAVGDDINALEVEGLKMFGAKNWEFKSEVSRDSFLYRVGVYSYFVIRPVRLV